MPARPAVAVRSRCTNHGQSLGFPGHEGRFLLSGFTMKTFNTYKARLLEKAKAPDQLLGGLGGSRILTPARRLGMGQNSQAPRLADNPVHFLHLPEFPVDKGRPSLVHLGF